MAIISLKMNHKSPHVQTCITVVFANMQDKFVTQHYSYKLVLFGTLFM